MHNRRLHMTDLGKPGESHGLTGKRQGLNRQEAAGRVFGRFWYQTESFVWSKAGPLVGHSELLLTPATSSENTSHRVNGILALQWLEVWIQFSHSSQFARRHYFYSCTDGTYQICQNSMHSIRVGHYLMGSLRMLRYLKKQGGYSIGFLARQYWWIDPCGWDSHFPRAISIQVWVRIHR